MPAPFANQVPDLRASGESIPEGNRPTSRALFECLANPAGTAHQAPTMVMLSGLLSGLGILRQSVLSRALALLARWQPIRLDAVVDFSCDALRHQELIVVRFLGCRSNRDAITALLRGEFTT